MIKLVSQLNYQREIHLKVNTAGQKNWLFYICFYLLNHYVNFKGLFTLFDSGLSQTHKIDNNGINANFVFSKIYSFLLHLHYMMLVNVNLDISGSKRITFEYYKLHCSCSFLMAQLKQSWQYWHSLLRRVCENLYCNHNFLSRQKGCDCDINTKSL